MHIVDSGGAGVPSPTSPSPGKISLAIVSAGWGTIGGCQMFRAEEVRQGQAICQGHINDCWEPPSILS